MNKIKFFSGVLTLSLLLLPTIAKTAPDNAEQIFSLTTVSGAYIKGYSGGFVTKAPDLFNECKDLVSVLKSKANDYYVVINGKEFKVEAYNVLDAPGYDENDIKYDGFNINLFVDKNKKNDNDYLYLDCAGNSNSVNFAFVGEKFGEKWSDKADIEKSLSILSVNNDLKKISTKGTFVQKGYVNGWGGYTYTTPWKSTFKNFDKTLVLVSELAKHEPKTFVTEYDTGGFVNYNKCLKSDKSFCFKKVGNKLMMFARTGWGSNSVDFWVK